MSKAFSVIVPSYNRADLVSATIDSLLQQILSPVEIIIVDDGSTDHTKEVVAGYGAQVRFIQLNNSGPAAARHAGVLASTCEYIAFCDSDDVWLPDHLSKLAQALEGAKTPYAFSNFSEVRNGRWEQADKFSTAPPGYWQFKKQLLGEDVSIADEPLYPLLLEFQPIFPSCTAMSRRFYDQVGGYNPAFGFIPSEDLEFTLRCVCHRGVGIVSKPTVGIRKHSGNMSADITKQLDGEIQILAYSQRHHRIDSVWNKAIRRQIIKRSILGFDSAFATSEIGLAREFARNIPLYRRSPKFYLKQAIACLPEVLAVKFSNKFAGSR